MSQPNPLARSIGEAVKASGLGRSTIYEEIKAGRLIARKVGARTIILEEDLQDYLRRLPKRIIENSEAATSEAAA